MKNTEINQFTDKEVIENIVDKREYLTKLKLNHAVTPLENPHELKNVRRDIARLLTEKKKRNI